MSGTETPTVRLVAAFLAVLGVLASLGFLGTLPDGTGAILATSCLIALALLGLPFRSGIRRIAAISACAALALLDLLLPDPTSRVVLFVLAGMAAGPPVVRRLGPALLATTLVVQLIGISSIGTDAGAFLATRLARLLGDDRAVLGASALGLPAILFCLCLLAWGARASRSCVVGLVLLLAAPLIAPLATPFAWHLFSTYGTHGHHPPLFAAVPVAAVLGTLGVAVGWSGAGRQAERESAGRRRPLPLVAGSIIGIVACLHLDGWMPYAAADRRVVFLNSGGLDWNRPSLERLDYPASTGMFGILPDSLRAAGWQVDALSTDRMRALSLADARVLVIINCAYEWSPEDRRAIAAFVDSGGSVLALGDHTDVFGLMRGMNGLLADWGIRFRFDSAYHAGSGWSGDLFWNPGSLGLHLDPRRAGISIGASLSTTYPARPLVRARYAFSDAGDRSNAVGAFLGDYEHESGEELGDLVVAAHRSLGKGNVVVFGDTSGFQNTSLEETFDHFVLPLFERLAKPRSWPLPFGLLAATSVLLAALVVLLLRPRDGVPRGASAASLGLAFLATVGALPGSRAPGPAQHGVLLVDESTFPNTGHFGAQWNTVIPLQLAALRAGMLARRGSLAREPRARETIAIIAPRRTLDGDDVERLLAVLDGGGGIIVCASGREAAAVAPLLRRFGVTVVPATLGSVPDVARQDPAAPRFVDASPLLIDEGTRHQVLYKLGDHVLAAALRPRAGSLVVVGDSRFFSYRNVEGLWGAWPGNVRFAYDLIERAAGGNVIARRAPFDPPEGGS